MKLNKLTNKIYSEAQNVLQNQNYDCEYWTGVKEEEENEVYFFSNDVLGWDKIIIEAWTCATSMNEFWENL